MTTNKGGSSNTYPFQTKAQIKARIAESDAFVCECVQILQARQTASEQETGTTSVKNRAGWMSSHAVPMGKLAAKLTAGEDLTADEVSKSRDAVGHYSKQLAAAFRDAACAVAVFSGARPAVVALGCGEVSIQGLLPLVQGLFAVLDRLGAYMGVRNEEAPR